MPTSLQNWLMRAMGLLRFSTFWMSMRGFLLYFFSEPRPSSFCFSGFISCAPRSGLCVRERAALRGGAHLEDVVEELDQADALAEVLDDADHRRHLHAPERLVRRPPLSPRARAEQAEPTSLLRPKYMFTQAVNVFICCRSHPAASP